MKTNKRDASGEAVRWRAVAVATLALLTVLWPDRADAYIDPGIGSMIFQAALAAILGLGLVFKNLRLRIWAFLKRLSGSKEDS